VRLPFYGRFLGGLSGSAGGPSTMGVARGGKVRMDGYAVTRERYERPRVGRAASPLDEGLPAQGSRGRSRLGCAG